MHLATSPSFKQNVTAAIANASLQKALANSRPQFMARRTTAYANLPEFERLRDIAQDIVARDIVRTNLAP